MYQTKADVFNRVVEHKDEVEKFGHTCFFVGLQGSWNYDLGYEGSDVDTKALIVPSLKNIVLNNSPISTTHILMNNEHVDLKDARVMFQNFWKQNINFVEILFTDYAVANPLFAEEYDALLDIAEDIAYYDVKRAVNAVCGMALEKYHALEKIYPTTKDKIEKYGYDGKQLHHILRLEDFMTAYMKGYSFKECLTSFTIFSREELMRAKRSAYSLGEARVLASTTCERLKEEKDRFLDKYTFTPNEKVKKEAEEILYSVFEKQFRKELNEN